MNYKVTEIINYIILIWKQKQKMMLSTILKTDLKINLIFFTII